MGRLVLTREPREEVRLILPDGREALIGNAGDRKAKIAIEAPPDVIVLRRELPPRAAAAPRPAA